MAKLVETVNALSGPEFFKQYADIGTLLVDESPGLRVSTSNANDLAKDALDACLALIELTSAQDYQNSEIKWSASKKRKEMKLPDMKYIVLFDEQSGSLAGFISFMVTYEDGYEVLYLYEIHFTPSWQGKGVGKRLMDVIESIGKRVGLEKVMLTVFRSNTRAVTWYQTLNYVEDEYSPAPRRLRNGTVKEPTYIIMSKRLKD
ncbi:hypothetical protein B0A52_02833 [Exophiala mesophila]|uniref:N-alpha-acetyltransferase 40 n=1 Tax=Exophiala mesophila TaxID=212818 RepID=A0A438NDS4_EXOME|nr:hypothetical protein B0A52_02833 [Exophiala mesophila]